MSDNVSTRAQQDCLANEKFVMKVFTCVDHRSQYAEQKLLYVMVVQDGCDEDNTADLGEIDIKDLHQVLSKPFLWKQPKGKVYAKLSSGDMMSRQELEVNRILQFRHSEKFKFKLHPAAPSITVDIELADEHSQLCEEQALDLKLFPTRETKAAAENPTS